MILTSFSGINTTGINLLVPQGITSGYLKFLNDKGYSYSPQQLTLIPSADIRITSNYTGVFKDSIRISGSNLSGSIVYFNSVNGILVTGDNIVRVDNTGIYFNVPREIISGPIIIRGRNDVIVQDTGNFVVLPTISGISGNLTYATGGYITITGINAYESLNFLGLSGTTGNYLNLVLNNDFVNDVRYITGVSYPGTGYSLITVRLGTGYAGTGRLFLASTQDSLMPSGITNSHTYTFKNQTVFHQPITISQPSPTINLVTPTGGSRNTIITITGTSLLSTNNVIFNVGSSYTLGSIISVTDTMVRVKPPFIAPVASGTGFIYLATPFGIASSGAFRLLPILSISGYTPTNGLTGDSIRITGSGLQGATGVYFGQYSGVFNGVSELGTWVLSGIVPSNYSCCTSDIQICVYNEGDSYCL